DDRGEFAHRWIEEIEAAHHRDDQSAFLANRQRPEIFRCRPGVVLACCGIVTVDDGAPDVDPPEDVRLRVPIGSLAKERLRIDHALDIDHEVSPFIVSVRRKVARSAAARSEKASLASDTVTRMTTP